MNPFISPLENSSSEQPPQERFFGNVMSLHNYRMDTTKSSKYRRNLKTDLIAIEADPSFESSKTKFLLSGILGEALFYTMCQEANIPIRVSTGKEDLDGIDFYIFDQPIDISTSRNSEILSRKVGKDSAQLLCVPHFLKQKHIVHTGNSCQGQLEEFLDGNLLPYEYFTSLYFINEELRNLMASYLMNGTTNGYKIDFKDIDSKKIYRLGNLLTLISCRLKQLQK